MEEERKLIPILREGIDIIKMVFFLKLKNYLLIRYKDRGASFASYMAGAIINELFGTPNPAQPYASFAKEHETAIAQEIYRLSDAFQEMRIPLTDALRVQFLCDYQEGIDSSGILEKAKQINLLIVDREVPLPAKFLDLARKLGGAFDLLARP